MLFCVKTPINKLYVFGMALLLAATLAGCGGGGGTAAQCPPGQVGTPPNCTTPPPQPTPATPDEQFAARMARSNAESAKMAAMAAMGGGDGSVAMAAAAATAAGASATAAADSASMAMTARTDYMNAQMASAAAAADNATAMAAKQAADDAQTALSDAVTAYEAAVKDQDIETKAGATAIKSAADTLKAAAIKAQADAMDAQTAAEAARDMAMDDADDAAMYAATHVLGLFKAANHVSVEDADDRKAEIVKVAAAIAGAAASTGSRNDSRDSGEASATATWPADTTDDDDNVVEAGVLSVTIAGLGDNFTSDTEGTDANDDGDTDDTGDTAPNAKSITGLPGFMHGLDISPGGRRHVIVFTDKEQGTPAVAAVAAVTAKTLTNDDVNGNTVTDLGAMSGNGYTGVTYYEGTDTSDSGTAFMGTLTCPSGTDCSAETAGDGTITVSGYTFTGSRAAREAVADADAAEDDSYLAFGVWLHEDNNTAVGNQPAFGAFYGGGDSASGNFTPVEGTATYNGAATGVYTQGSSVDYFQGSATLTADFGEDDESGAISGMISNIVAGGMAMSDVIDLHASPINTNATFGGSASMGPSTVTGTTATYDYNGTWSGRFYNPVDDDDGNNDLTKAPGSVAGSFGVTGTVDQVTTSYVGAFGAHKQ